MDYSDFTPDRNYSALRSPSFVGNDGFRYRVVATYDTYQHTPDGDDAAVIRLADHRFAAESVMAPHGMAGHLDDLVSALNRAESVDVWKRWLHVFHNGATEKISGIAIEGTYVGVVTDTLREYWGAPQDSMEMCLDEWHAYADGDVYALHVEKLDSCGYWHDVPDEHLFLAYGDDSAAEQATEMLSWFGVDTYSDYNPCPICGDPSDYCLGHGIEATAAILAHDDGDHSTCNPDWCDDAPLFKGAGEPLSDWDE